VTPLHRRSLLTAVLLLSGAWTVPAAAQGVRAEVRSAVLLRALAYEAAFAGGSGEALLAVVGPESGPAADHADEAATGFARLVRRMRVASRPVRVIRVTHRSNASTISALRAQGVAAVYVAPGLDGLASAIAGGLSGRNATVMCVAGEIGNGCTLGVERYGSGSRIVLHIGAMRAAGLTFDARLLRLARVIR